ncbi:hypothetical protein [Methylomonas sp. MgM2]
MDRIFIYFLMMMCITGCTQKSKPVTPTLFSNDQLEKERKLRNADLERARAFEVEENKFLAASYGINLVNVDVSTKESGEIANNMFKTKEVDFSWEPNSNTFVFKLKNKSDKTVKIVWDSVVFIDSFDESHKVIHSGVRLVDRNSSQPPTVIVKGSHVNDTLQPADYINWVSSYSSVPGRWDEQSILPTTIYGGNADRTAFREIITAQVGKKLKVMMTLDFSGVLKEYLFEFEVKKAEAMGPRNSP